MTNLNPILRPNRNPASPGKPVNPKPIERSERQVRSDKIHDLKFPVTPAERSEFRRQAKLKGMTETKFATALLLRAISLFRSAPLRFTDLPYTDTKQYLHCKPTEFQYDEIFQISLAWNVSVRQAVHRLMITMIQGSGPR